ncbi:hypothetical protein AB6A40_010800 [Gnathostoma spinigerum]|uniref:Uncharacterized protein n=1 Tax=Gnathostoma spinigerum TaxID=75299 RepID=A0ABD6EXN5_9BILA
MDAYRVCSDYLLMLRLFSEMEDSATSHEWELNRENIRPLRGGCNVESLNSVFGGPRFTLADADAKFEEDFKAAETSEDPLEICCTFVLWFENNFPTG